MLNRSDGVDGEMPRGAEILDFIRSGAAKAAPLLFWMARVAAGGEAHRLKRSQVEFAVCVGARCGPSAFFMDLPLQASKN